MSVNGRGTTAPSLNNADESSLREFWEVYETRFAEIGAQLADDSAAHPELANFVGAGDPDSVAGNRERIGQAINDGDWESYLADMVDTGARYAEAGLSFSAWFATGRALRSKLVPLLIDALADEPERLADALRGLSIFIDLVILAVGESFIDSERALLLTGKLLEAIADKRAKAVVLDITGVPAVDSAVANHLMQTVQAASSPPARSSRRPRRERSNTARSSPGREHPDSQAWADADRLPAVRADRC